MNTSFGRIPTQNNLPFTNPRRPLRSHISTSKVGLASVPLGTAPGYASEHDTFSYSGIANRQGVVDIGIR